MNDKPPMVICSTSGKCLPVLLASIAAYVPADVEIYLSTARPVDTGCLRQKCIILQNEASNFGDAYNAAMRQALQDGHDSLIIANDDIVLVPDSYTTLVEDVAYIRDHGFRLGLMGTRSDRIAGLQNVRRSTMEEDGIDPRMSQFRAESSIAIGLSVIFPVLAWISGEALGRCMFPPINWFSDTVLCQDLTELGFVHCISRSYCHHVGSATLGGHVKRHFDEAMEWVQVHRPALAEVLKGLYANDW